QPMHRARRRPNQFASLLRSFLRSFRRAWTLLCLLGCGILFFVPAASPATDVPRWVASASESVNATMRDLDLTLQARKSLLQVDELSGLNVGISVQGRAATAWGSVPSAELSRRVEECLRR